MNRIMHALAMVGLVTTVMPGGAIAAEAPSMAKIVRDWGLLGTWAVDCKAPPSRSNVFSTYLVHHGKVFLKRAFGEKLDDSNEIVAVTVVAGDLLEFTVELRALNQVRVTAVQRDTPTRLRTVWNRGADGRYTVRSGRVLADGTQTPRQSRCR